jgi:hypothetical protein
MSTDLLETYRELKKKHVIEEIVRQVGHLSEHLNCNYFEADIKLFIATNICYSCICWSSTIKYFVVHQIFAFENGINTWRFYSHDLYTRTKDLLWGISNTKVFYLDLL